MSNTCGWSAVDPDTQALMDVICNGFQTWCQGNDRWIGANATVADMVDAFESNFDSLTSRIAITESLANTTLTDVQDATFGLSALKTKLNSVGTDASNAASRASTAITDITTVDGKLGYPTGTAATIAQDFINTRTAFAIVDTLNNLVDLRWGGGSTTWGNALETIAAWFQDKTGVLKPIAQNDAQLSGGAAPPLSLLTLDSAIAISTGTEETIPVGTYGVWFALSVPVYWGRRNNSPNLYVPSVAKLTWNSPIGPLDNPKPIHVAFPTAYPLNPAASSFNMTLAVNVTGTFQWLRLPH